MKTLHVNTGWQTSSLFFMDDTKADAAYAAIKAAMGPYDKYSNDKSKSVSFETDAGEATFRIEALLAVDLEDCSEVEKAVIEREVWAATIKSKVAARLAPAVA